MPKELIGPAIDTGSRVSSYYQRRNCMGLLDFSVGEHYPAFMMMVVNPPGAVKMASEHPHDLFAGIPERNIVARRNRTGFKFDSAAY